MSIEDRSARVGGGGYATDVGGAGGYVGGYYATGATFAAILTAGADLAPDLETEIAMAASLDAGVSLSAALSTAIQMAAALTAGAELEADLSDEYGIQDLLEWPDRDLIVLAECEPSIVLSEFTATPATSHTYQAVFPRRRETAKIAGGLYAPCIRVRENATDLDEEDSIANVDANAGSWWWDEVNEILYIHTTGGGDPAAYTLYQAFVRVYFSTKGVTLNQVIDDPDSGVYYHPWITDDSEAATEQVGDGLFSVKATPSATLILGNMGGVFHGILAPNSVWVWRNRRVRLWVGGSLRTTVIERPYYNQFLSMLIDEAATTDTKATFVLKPRAQRLDQSLPVTPIFETEYPNLDQGVRGLLKPLLYGRMTTAPLLVDTVTSQGVYLVADAAFQALNAVHNVWAVAKDTGAMTLLTLTTHYTVNLAACTITIVSATYSYLNYSIHAEVTGKTANTAAAIVEDILRTHLGATDDDLDLDSFANAAAEAPETLAVALTSERTIGSILSTSEPTQPSIERSVLAVLRETQDGRWQFKVRALISTGGDLDVSLGQRDFASFEPEIARETAFAETAVFYGWKPATGSWAFESYVDQRTKYLLAADNAGEDSDRADLYTYLTDPDDAQTLARRYQAIAGGTRLRIVFAERSAKLYRSLVGDQVTVTYSPAPDASGSFENERFELTEVRKAVVPTLQTGGVLRDTRGLTNGWAWAQDNAPDDWASTSPDERGRYGYWAGDDGRIDPLDPATEDIRKWM